MYQDLSISGITSSDKINEKLLTEDPYIEVGMKMDMVIICNKSIITGQWCQRCPKIDEETWINDKCMWTKLVDYLQPV